MINPTFVTNAQLLGQHQYIAEKGYLYAVIVETDVPFSVDQIAREWEVVCAEESSFARYYFDSAIVRIPMPLWVVVQPLDGEWVVCGASNDSEDFAGLLSGPGSYSIVPGDKISKLPNRPSVFGIAA